MEGGKKVLDRLIKGNKNKLEENTKCICTHHATEILGSR